MSYLEIVATARVSVVSSVHDVHYAKNSCECFVVEVQAAGKPGTDCPEFEMPIQHIESFSVLEALMGSRRHHRSGRSRTRSGSGPLEFAAPQLKSAKNADSIHSVRVALEGETTREAVFSASSGGARRGEWRRPQVRGGTLQGRGAPQAAALPSCAGLAAQNITTGTFKRFVLGGIDADVGNQIDIFQH